MFEPLGDIIRRRRIERNLSQEALARLADVSRRHLDLLEKNDANVSILILVKLANALELTELAIGDLCLRAGGPELKPMLEAADAVATARRTVAEADALLAAIDERLESSARDLDAVIGRALTAVGSGRRIIDAALRLDADGTAAVSETLRDLGEPSRLSIPPVRRKAAVPKPAARKRDR